MAFATSCAHNKCGGIITDMTPKENVVKVETKIGDDYYHRGCWRGIRLKEARRVVAEVTPGALRVRMFHKLRNHRVD